MPRSGPEGVSPTEMFPFSVGQTPDDDRTYFEMLCWFVFGSGLNWRIMRSKWPNFQRAFRKFNIDKVAMFGEEDIDRLLNDAGIIRNGRKITGTIDNARAIRVIKRAHGGMTPWLRGYGGDTTALIRDVKKHFSHMGDTTARMFLTCVGAIEYQTWEPTERQRLGTE
ncbi:MAG: DNA-3-methyladenine glycosylase I [Chloroflexota bacterium]|nr:DNA-3-methyladenine glycosylase I [Chloroflexota bacterium]